MVLVKLVIESKVAKIIVSHQYFTEELVLDNIPLGMLSVYIKDFSRDDHYVHKECCKLLSVYLEQKALEFERISKI